MAVSKYKAKGRVYWEVDVWLKQDGKRVRFRRGKLSTREEAVSLEAQALGQKSEPTHESTNHCYFRAAWEAYVPVGERDNRAWVTDRGRAKPLLRHLGHVQAADLTVDDVNAYRIRRGKEKTRRGSPPSPAQLDREVELLKRVLNHAVDCRRLAVNPLARCRLLRRPNVRKRSLSEADFLRLCTRAEPFLRPILTLAYDTGMRLREVLDLRWEQVSLEDASVRLWADNTKTEEPRLLALTPRALVALESCPKRDGPVFLNPNTRRPWADIRKPFRRAADSAGLSWLWFHDLRRSFVTRARKAGVPESVVMKMSGHKTRSVFDRYNVVDDSDIRKAALALAQH